MDLKAGEIWLQTSRPANCMQAIPILVPIPAAMTD